MSSEETESVCAAPLYHAIVKPEGLELNIHSYPETFSGAEMTRTNSFSLLDMEGKTEKMDTIKIFFFLGVELPRFSVLPPAYRVASLWPSLHLHSTRTSQSRSPESTKRKRSWWVKALRFFVKLIYRRTCTLLRCLTLDPLSLKMISTSRILPNCWNIKKRRH